VAAISTHLPLFSVRLHQPNTQAKGGGFYNLFDLFYIRLNPDKVWDSSYNKHTSYCNARVFVLVLKKHEGASGLEAMGQRMGCPAQRWTLGALRFRVLGLLRFQVTQQESRKASYSAHQVVFLLRPRPAATQQQRQRHGSSSRLAIPR
jgi:hypothetical protein